MPRATWAPGLPVRSTASECVPWPIASDISACQAGMELDLIDAMAEAVVAAQLRRMPVGVVRQPATRALATVAPASVRSACAQPSFSRPAISPSRRSP